MVVNCVLLLFKSLHWVLDLLVYPADLCFRQVFAVVFYLSICLTWQSCKIKLPSVLTQSEAVEWSRHVAWSVWLKTRWALFLSQASIDCAVVSCICFRQWLNKSSPVREYWKGQDWIWEVRKIHLQIRPSEHHDVEIISWLSDEEAELALLR